MNLADLITVFRARTFDTEAPYLWSDDELGEYATDAENEAAERAKLIKDSTTAEICQVAVTAGNAVYYLDQRVITVERAKLTLGNYPLDLSSTAQMDNGTRPVVNQWRSTPTYNNWLGTDWQKATGTPVRLLLDDEQSRWKATLYPIPVVNDTLNLTLYRLPLGPLSTDQGNVPEIPYRLHIRLVDWMMARAYRKQDAETRDEAKADRYEAAFAQTFGERIDANARRKQEARAPVVVQFQEF